MTLQCVHSVVSEQEEVVAFTVTHGETRSYSPGEKIEFEGSVITNEGGGYFPGQHEFNCPVSGLYQFILSVSATNNGNTITEIWMSDSENEVFLVTAHATGLSWAATIVIQCLYIVLVAIGFMSCVVTSSLV